MTVDDDMLKRNRMQSGFGDHEDGALRFPAHFPGNRAHVVLQHVFLLQGTDDEQVNDVFLANLDDRIHRLSLFPDHSGVRIIETIVIQETSQLPLLFGSFFPTWMNSAFA